MKVLLISPFHGNSSHAAWAQGLQKWSRHEVTLATLPDRGWSWRLKGGCVPLHDLLSKKGEDYDVLLATSLTCLTSLFGLLRRSSLSKLPTIYYMHENQLTYPIRQGGKRDSQLILRQFHSQMAADEIWFNSSYNLECWFESLPTFLRNFPDHHGLEHLPALRNRSRVVPVGLELPQTPPSERLKEHLLLWNHRWEWEKGIDRFTKFITGLPPTFDFKVALLGGEPKGQDPQREKLKSFLGPRLVHSGWCDRKEYDQWLRRATFTLSMARHEFFGISVLEAAANGVVPFLPRRLSYPELFGAQLQEELFYQNLGDLQSKLQNFLLTPTPESSLLTSLWETAWAYDWSRLVERYDEALEATGK